MTKSNTAAAAKNQGNGASASNPSQPDATMQPNAAAAGSASASLEIPTLTGAPAAAPKAPPAPVLQEGEDAAALAGHGGRQSTDGYAAMAGGAAEIGPGSQPTSLADIQAHVDAQQARPSKAMHRPAIMRQDREQTADNPRMTLEMPVSGSLDNMLRPDQYIEPISDITTFKDKAAKLAFLEEFLIIRIHETGNLNDEPIVQLGVNGRQVFIKRGVDSIVRRKYVEMLLRAKPENLQTRIERDGQGNPRNFIDKTRALKYPFSIVRDDNPMGRAWERKIRMEA